LPHSTRSPIRATGLPSTSVRLAAVSTIPPCVVGSPCRAMAGMVSGLSPAG
jgi:hypothetical protein